MLAAAALAPLAVSPVQAAGCRDAKGKFIKCPAKAPTKATKCKGAKGKFAACGTPGSKPVD